MKLVAKIARETFRKSGVDQILPLLTIGRAPRSLLARLAPLNKQYPSPTLRRAIRDGITYELDLSDFMEWFLYFGLEVEPRDRLLELVAEDFVVIDVGANIGEVAMKLARKVGEGGRVFAFEPSPLVATKLRKNLSLNQFPHVEAIAMGLGSEEGELFLATPTESNRGGLRISKTGERVPVTTLDSFVEARNLRKIDLIKIDVEGFEASVLNGARGLLERWRPALFIELSDLNLREQGSSAKDLLRFLEGFGYQITNSKTGAPLQSSMEFGGLHCDIECQVPQATKGLKS